jgi:hypothetical protein
MTKETEIEATPPVAQVSRDEETTEIVETVELAPLEKTDARDYEDVLAEDEDPRGAIYARHNEKRDKELDGSELTDAAKGYVEEDNPEIPVEKDTSPTIIEDQTDTEMVEVKVLGDLRNVPKSKIDAAGGVENYQIRLAAQEQMERNAHERAANEARQVAQDERERLWNEQQAAIPTQDSQEANPNPTDLPTDDQNLDILAAQHQEAMFDGDENAPSILVKLTKAAAAQAASQGQPFDQKAFAQQVKDELIEDQRKAKIVTAGHALIDLHPELNQRDTKFDPRLFTAVDDETEVVKRQHPEWEPEKIVQEAYDRVHKWKGAHKTETMDAKQEEKRAMSRPRSGTQRYTQPPPAPVPTRSDYVAKQRKLRGQEA